MKFITYLLIFSVTCISSCSTSRQASTGIKHEMLSSNAFKLTEVSVDASYGFTQTNPIKVGNSLMTDGPENERRYLNALLGPNGEQISYTRQGSCCQVESKNRLGYAILDIYQVTYEGLDKPIILYINMYDSEILKAPKGFTFRQ